MKTIVVYRSITGFTKKYAQWIADELEADLFDCREIAPGVLCKYDLFIFGSSIHNNRIKDINFFMRHIAVLIGKRKIIFVTGGSEVREGIAEEILASNFSEEQQKQFQLFYFRGGFDYGKLGIKDKTIMILKKWRLRIKKRKEDLTSDEKDLLSAYANPADGTKKDNIRILIDYARS
jgi:menaquinone-dependent protoporphyrinogen IX oxidase